MDRNPGVKWRIDIVSADGQGSPRAVVENDEIQAAPDWSPDENFLVFGGEPLDVTGDSNASSIHLFDMKTRRASALPNSEGLYCPRWSPNGQYISAPSADGSRLMLFDFTTRKWAEIAKLSEGCPTWSRDGQYLYFQTFDLPDPEFVRVRVFDRKRESIARINIRRVQDIWYRWWNGLTPDDAPVVLRDEGEEEIYALDWDLP